MLQQLTGTMDMESLNSALAAVAVSDDDLRQLDELDADELRALVKSAYEQVAAKERDLLLAAEIGQSLLDANTDLKNALAAAELSAARATLAERVKAGIAADTLPPEWDEILAKLQAHNTDLQARTDELERELRELRVAATKETRRLTDEVAAQRDRADAAEAKLADVTATKDRLAREKLELKVRLAKLASQPIPDDADAEAPEPAADEAAPVPEHLAELTEELYQLRDERDALSEANAELATKLADALTTVDDFAARTAKSERKVAEFRHLQDSYKYQAQHITELSELVEKQRVWLNQLTDGEELPAVARPNRSADAAMRESNSSLISELERAWSQQQAEPPKGFFGLLDSLRAFVQE
ncbi:hypothetical protein AMAG_13847 [Allomyces macrogynus ATCC 38327]|uniref:Uncharacterized protein n=1 Tax=Allomyces macrogynus (strain ATCC 38327) TaxID=578462 RepID=A0A0L0T2M1_ALLM3|nr:hypothetical protein GGF32_004109 [Allomyces javanicus]KAJ3372522.1 hypothetical protein GGF31_001963 [Allomyces arbusculus]KNE68971.1 hypothetical protein AMAG_13847 [Allomyces macrogynus ATCC 38327]|eukprot:KNE68971.1 hypothetical protein AMAG_13847 [Allomyces macrogynus ATCC 38327]